MTDIVITRRHNKIFSKNSVLSMDGKNIEVRCFSFCARRVCGRYERGGIEVQNIIYTDIDAQKHVEYTRTEYKKVTGEGKGSANMIFLNQMQKLAKSKDPKEMTLAEYRDYIREKVQKSVLPFCGGELSVSVEFSDMALVMMKSDPELEKLVLKGLWSELCKEVKKNKEKYLNMDVQIKHEREKKAEEKETERRRLLRKKKLQLWFEKRAEQREDYTEFLETGKRYVLPCPAAEMMKLMGSLGSLGSFLGM